VTGTTSGIGTVTATRLAQLGASVVLLDRDPQRMQSVAKEITRKTGNKNIECIQCDLADMASVAAAANKFLQSHEILNILVNNAGVMMCPLLKTAQGFEMQFGTNHLGHFLLTMKLLPALMNGARGGMGRVVAVSSRRHFLAPKAGIDFSNLTHEELLASGLYDPLANYGQSKLANILFASELQRRFGSHEIAAFSLHPGVIRTNLARHLPWSPRAFIFRHFLAKSVTSGAQTQLHCALAPISDLSPGQYYADCVLAPTLPAAKDETLARQLWEFSSEQVANYMK
jgi:NAD(P)-dependent dehydrogenase (short-subunit alcohol dehydrogenase family)